jgi:hypothetical protein
MDDLRFGMSRMHRETGVHRNSLRYWISKGWLKRGRDGTMSLWDVQKIRDERSADKKPKRASLALLSKREEELGWPFVGPGGLRRLQRALNAVAIVARDDEWTDAKKKRFAQALQAAADEIFVLRDHRSNAGTDEAPLKRRENEKRRLAEAGRTSASKKRCSIVYEQADPTEPPYEITPSFVDRISEEDEQYVLLDAKNPSDFVKRARERGLEVRIGKSHDADRSLPEGYPRYEKGANRRFYEPSCTPDFASEIERKSEKQQATREDILARYRAITDPAERETFRHFNWEAIRDARMARHEPINYEALLEIARRVSEKKWKWIKIDDGHTFKSVPA